MSRSGPEKSFPPIGNLIGRDVALVGKITGSRWSVAGGYLLGAALMIAAAIVAARYCVPAERKPLEAVSRPLAAVD